MNAKIWMAAAWLGASLSAPALAGKADGPPWWTQDLPLAIRAGGSSGLACVAMPLPKGVLLMPAHCVPGSDPSASGKDYAWSNSGEQRMKVLEQGLVARRRHAPGETIWIQRGARWTKASIAASSGSSYWVQAREEGFCPGDSGSSVWVGENGEPKWLAMIVSGGEASEKGGCSGQGAAVAFSAIDWPWER